MKVRVRRRDKAVLVFLVLATPAFAAEKAAEPSPGALEFFERKVRPILVENCYTCHSAETNAKGGLRVDDRNGLLTGGNAGPAVVPGDVDKSLLIAAVKHEDGMKMPPKKKLTDEQIADLSRWVREGAAWPAPRPTVNLAKTNPRYEQLRREHWAWQPVRAPKPPAVRNESWPRSDVDRFVLAELEKQRLSPVGDADKRSLIRRVTFDLTGLPPTPDAIAAFLADVSPNALETVVDRLLASPAFGERWGRHWLDVARFGESTGSSRNLPMPHAWRFREYVIDAINKDKPQDAFIREQIAGDLLDHASETERREHLIATGFLAIGVKDVNQRFRVRYVMDNVDEQIDAVSRAFLGLTVSCARCHDHKFDPIPTADYYAMAGIFTSTEMGAGLRNKMGGGGLDYYDTALVLKLGSPTAQADSARAARIDAAKKAADEARKAFEAIRDKPEGDEKTAEGLPKRQVARRKMVRLQNELLALTDPAADGDAYLGVREAKTVADTQVRFRGEAEKIGPTVPRGFPSVASFPGAPTIESSHSGRLELARWLTDPRNPLTARVAVNRVWLHLFGRGIVGTVDNFGVTGERPTHPELLDYLADRFVKEGWSLKRLVKSLVLTRAYGLSAEAPAEHLRRDPENRLVWRHAPRRLDAEEQRDASLLASGALSLARPADSPTRALKVIEIRDNGPEARRIQEYANAARFRSVYMPLARGITPTSLAIYDFAEQGMVTGRRDTTTVATQALYQLNDGFVRRRSLDLAERELARTDLDDAARIDRIFLGVLGRPASATERERVTAFLAEYESIAKKQPPRAETKPAEPAATPRAARPAVPVNPDEVDQSDEPVREEAVIPSTPRAAAWAAFAQALFGTAEYRYLR